MIAPDQVVASKSVGGKVVTVESSAVSPVTEGVRPGLPVDPRRFLGAIRRSRRVFAGVAVVSAVAGALVGKLVVPKTYASSATILWEPPSAAKADAVREIATIAQSVKLPSNLRKIRDRIADPPSLETLAKGLEVKPGENSMLITVSGKGATSEGAATLAQTAVDVFLESQRVKAQARLQGTVDALRQSLAQAEQAQTDARTRYGAFRSMHHVEDFPAEIQTAIQEVARLRAAASDSEVELKGLQAKVHALREAKLVAPEKVVISRQEQLEDEARRGQLETELAGLRGKLTDDHPKVKAVTAELEAVREHGKTASPIVASQVVGRSSLRDTLSIQLEESSVMNKAYEERSRKLADLKAQAEERAASLSDVEGEAARLLADVKANEDHVSLLLKQLAMAEDDVRVATSGFQLVSMAVPPERSEKGLGRVAAVVIPLVSLMLTLGWVVVRELKKLKARSPSEVAFWAGAPVLASIPASVPAPPSTPVEKPSVADRFSLASLAAPILARASINPPSVAPAAALSPSLGSISMSPISMTPALVSTKSVSPKSRSSKSTAPASSSAKSSAPKARVSSAPQRLSIPPSPVETTAPSPHAEAHALEVRTAVRHMTDMLEGRPAVLGWTRLGRAGDEGLGAAFSSMVVERLKQRGVSATHVSASVGVNARGFTSEMALDERLESSTFGRWIEKFSSKHEHVSVELPSLDQPAAVRAALRWLDGVIVVVGAGEQDILALRRLRELLGLDRLGLGFVVVSVPDELSSSTISTGDSSTLWKPSKRADSKDNQPKKAAPRARVSPSEKPRATAVASVSPARKRVSRAPR